MIPLPVEVTGRNTNTDAEFRNMSVTDLTREKSDIPNAAIVASPIEYHIADQVFGRILGDCSARSLDLRSF